MRSVELEAEEARKALQSQVQEVLEVEAATKASLREVTGKFEQE